MFESGFLWLAFNLFVIVMLALDLGVLNRKSKEITVRGALTWTAVWIVLALLFNLLIYHQFGKEQAMGFLTGYLLEKSLSIDNIFVIILIFGTFNVPKAYQHKVLFWGIVGALVMRVIFIFSGIELIHRFHWLIYIFGGFLVFTGVRMLSSSDALIDPGSHPVVKFVRRIFPVTDAFRADNFFVRIEGKLWATPLFVVMLLIEGTDLIFAVDSIPAILAISDDPFIVYTSNVFAILGLRSLYFALSGIESYFKFLKYGLSAILVFVGFKMCMADLIKIPVELSLLVIIGVLAVSILSSLVVRKGESEPAGTLDAK
jgi:tellurite resistance protein TerC